MPSRRLSLRKADSRRGAGFTLVELLVVISIIGVLTSLLLPAVQMVRESGRQAECKNNLYQIGVGLNSYHTQFGSFPTGCTEWRPYGNQTKKQIAWSAHLLPFIEKQSVYDALDLSTPFDSPENEAGAATIIPLYLCPSSIREEERTKGRGPCDYGGMYGERITSPNNPPKGTMLYDRAISLIEIKDGASNTLIVAEDSSWSDGQWINGRNIFDQAFPINDAPSFENDIRSNHPGGALGVFADGSVHFLSESIDMQILAAICTRAQGEIISGF